MRKMYITKPLLVKSENYTLMSLEVQSTFAPVVASCGINTVLSLLKRLTNPTAGKYLLTKTSVDGIECICQS